MVIEFVSSNDFRPTTSYNFNDERSIKDIIIGLQNYDVAIGDIKKINTYLIKKQYDYAFIANDILQSEKSLIKQFITDNIGKRYLFDLLMKIIKQTKNNTIDNNNYYNILGINNNAKQKDLRKAFRKKINDEIDPYQYEKYDELFNRLQTAFNTLNNPFTRNLYDKYGINFDKKWNEYQEIIQYEEQRQKREKYENASKILTLINGFIRSIIILFVKDNIYIPLSVKNIIISFYPKSLDGILIIESNQTKILKSNVEYNFELIIIEKNATLTVVGWDPEKHEGGKLLINTMFNIAIHENGCIDLNGKGYRGGSGYQPGESINGRIGSQWYYSRNDVMKDSNYGGGGGGLDTYHGGNAGYGTKGAASWKNANEGNIYGDRTLSVLHLGSGGGGYDDDEPDMPHGQTWTCHGGNGGGALRMNCNELILGENASILCNGMKGAGSGKYPITGCGSGGSIHLIVKSRFMMHSTAMISAIGGKQNELCFGGDGRIKCEITDQIATIQTVNITPDPYIELIDMT